MQKRKSLSPKVREAVYYKYDGHCAYCGKELTPKEFQVDHLIPVQRERFGKYTEEEILAILKELSDNDDCGIILRAKGIVPAQDGQWIHFDYVPGEPDVRLGSAAAIGRLCVIGSNLNEEKLTKIFDICHLCGKGKLDETLCQTEGYVQYEYIKEGSCPYSDTHYTSSHCVRTGCAAP